MANDSATTILPAPPTRVVSVAVTSDEILADLGADPQTVGVSRFADEDLKTALSEFVAIVAHALTEAQAQGFRKDASAKGLLIYGIGAALGAAMAVTDDLMRSVLGKPNGEEIIAEIADQIIPVDGR